MKLITELVEDVRYIQEDAAGGGKDYFIEGVFLQSEVKNRNGRVYPTPTMIKECRRYIKEYVDKGRALNLTTQADLQSTLTVFHTWLRI
jgi:hypothetical protein